MERTNRPSPPVDDPEGWLVVVTGRLESASGRFPVDAGLSQRLSERFIDACTGGDLDKLLELLDPAVDGAGDVAPEVLVGADVVGPGILCYLGLPASPTLLHLPVGDQIGIAGPGPRAAVATALGLAPP